MLTRINNYLLPSLFAVGAMMHLLSMTWPQLSVVPESETQHAVFFVINVYFVLLFTQREFHLPELQWSLGFLSLHQLVVHGASIVTMARAGTFDFQSVVALLSLALAWVLLRLEARAEGWES